MYFTMIIQHWWCVDLLMSPPSSPHSTDPWRQGLPIYCMLTVSVSSLNVIAEMHQTRGGTLDAYLLFRCSVEGASITHHYPEQNHPSPSRTPQVTSYPSLLLEQHDMGIFLTNYFLSECSCSARPRRVAQLVLESRNLARWFLSAATCK